MMNKHFLPALILSAAASGAAAQSQTQRAGEAEYLLDNTMQIWANTANSAGMGIDTIRNRGYAEFSADRREGSYHRVQEGSASNQITFHTERYQSIGRYLYGYGSFTFDNGTTKGRAWSDVMRTYESNPFISGSAVEGRYDHQDFMLRARLGTVSLNGWRAGIGMDYGVGDLSRLRDPRSRNRLLDYKVEPGITYTAGKATAGISAFYNRRKEKMPTLTTVQNAPDLWYYQMAGLDDVTGTMGGYSGFSREYVSHAFGAEMQLGIATPAFRSVTTASVSRAAESIYEQYKREPGKYYTYTYAATTQNRIVRGDVIHQIDAAAEYSQSYADQYRPQLVITIDPETGYKSYSYENLLTYRKRYQQESLAWSVRYRASFTRGKAVKAYVGVWTDGKHLSQKHLLPLSTFDRTTLSFNAEYGQGIMADNRIFITADAGYMTAAKAELDLSSPDTDYSRSVLLKDMAYYTASLFRGRLGIRYSWNMKLHKTQATCYVKAWGETIQAQHSLSATRFGLSVGVFN